MCVCGWGGGCQQTDWGGLRSVGKIMPGRDSLPEPCAIIHWDREGAGGRGDGGMGGRGTGTTRSWSLPGRGPFLVPLLLIDSEGPDHPSPASQLAHEEPDGLLRGSAKNGEHGVIL